ncbi:MAG: DUF4013 domain-containing protein [Fidelibacterota bacterium]
MFGIFFSEGYCFQVIRNVIKEDETPLPPWNELGKKFSHGIMLTIIFVVYLLPLAALSVILEHEYYDSGYLLLLTLAGILTFIPGAIINFARTGDFNSAFKLGEIWEIMSSNIGLFITAVLIIFGILTLFMMLGAIALGIGIPFFLFWGSLISAHILGQIGLEFERRREKDATA